MCFENKRVSYAHRVIRHQANFPHKSSKRKRSREDVRSSGTPIRCGESRCEKRQSKLMNRSPPKRCVNLKVRRRRNRGIHHRAVWIRMDWRCSKSSAASKIRVTTLRATKVVSTLFGHPGLSRPEVDKMDIRTIRQKGTIGMIRGREGMRLSRR